MLVLYPSALPIAAPNTASRFDTRSPALRTNRWAAEIEPSSLQEVHPIAEIASNRHVAWGKRVREPLLFCGLRSKPLCQVLQ